jgi:hypothetical protein
MAIDIADAAMAQDIADCPRYARGGGHDSASVDHARFWAASACPLAGLLPGRFRAASARIVCRPEGRADPPPEPQPLDVSWGLCDVRCCCSKLSGVVLRLSKLLFALVGARALFSASGFGGVGKGRGAFHTCTSGRPRGRSTVGPPLKDPGAPAHVSGPRQGPGRIQGVSICLRPALPACGRIRAGLVTVQPLDRPPRVAG